MNEGREIAILRRLSGDFVGIGAPTVATHWMNADTGRNTAGTRLMLKRMERRGLVVGVRVNGGNVCWWQITDAGIAALKEAPDADH